jgi:hypothetical protein
MIKKILLTLLEMNSETVKGFTGKKAKRSGVYRCDNQYIPLSKNETFPPSEGISVVWTLVVEL